MRESRLTELTVDLPDHPPRWVSHVFKTELIRQNVALRRSRLTAENTLAQQVITGRRDETRAQLSAVLCCMGPEYTQSASLTFRIYVIMRSCQGCVRGRPTDRTQQRTCNYLIAPLGTRARAIASTDNKQKNQNPGQSD